VPQEWVDIPKLAADTVQVNPDSGGSGFGDTTHLQLKSDGIMILGRTYCLDEDDLIDDLNILWVARQLCPQPTKSALQHSQLFAGSKQP